MRGRRAGDRERLSAAKALAEARGIHRTDLDRFLRRYAHRFGAHALLRNLAAADFRVETAENTLEYVFTKRLAVDALGAYFRAADRVLSIGCGDGLLEANLALRGCRVRGVDPDEGRILLARSLARRVGVSGRCGFARLRGDRFPARDGSVDVVLFSHSFHEIRGRKAAFRESHRVLKPGGRVLIVDNPEEVQSVARSLDGRHFAVTEKRLLFPGGNRPKGLAQPVGLLLLEKSRNVRRRA